MKDFKKPGSFGNPRGRNDYGRPNTGRPSFNDRRGGNKFGPPEMHEAICANCNQKCEVPFRPNDKKPVYCRDCFGKMGGGGTSDRFPKKEFSSRPPSRPQFENRSSGSNDQTTKQLEAVNAKLERLIRAVEALGSNVQAKPEIKTNTIAETTPTPESTPKKISKKKVAKK